MTAFQAEIMSRWDAGASIEQIAADTGYKRKSVYHVVSIYTGGEDELDVARIRIGTERLLDAIQTAGLVAV